VQQIIYREIDLQNFTSHAIVQSLIDAFAAQNSGLRQQHVYAQTLHALVRLAKSEQVMEIKANVRKLTGPMPVARSKPATSKISLDALAQLALPGLDERVGAQEAAPRRRK